MRLSRRRFLAAGAVGLSAVGINARWVEPNRVTISRHLLGTPDAGRAPLRLVQLTDLHLREVGRHEEEVAEAVHRLRPGLIAITGDSVDRRDRLGTLDGFLALLPAGVPTYATLGNWEHWAGVDPERLAATYAARGAQLLLNRSVRLEHAGRALLLTGVDDATAGRPRLRQALEGVEPAPNHLLLAHSPAYRERLGAELAAPGDGRARSAPEYMLSGHTHGGQVQLLGWAPMRPPGSGRYVEGWYRDARPHLYVSRGIGTSVVPVRLGAPPEVALFEWHLRADAP